MLHVLWVLVIVLAVAMAGILWLGDRRWRAGTRALRARIDAGRQPIHPGTVDFAELEGLPDPVRLYFQATLKEGAPMVSGVRIRHEGSFNMSETGEQWKPFTSDQRVVTRWPGFDWNARIAVVPGLPALVHDAFAGGEAILQASLFGLFALANQRGSGSDDLVIGELMRFFAEAAWYPTALLPSQGVTWREAGETEAWGTLHVGDIEIMLRFTFNENGAIERVRAESRGRLIGGKSVAMPWQGRFWDYQVKQGMTIPLAGEVAWITPDGELPYWRGRITDIAYEFAG